MTGPDCCCPHTRRAVRRMERMTAVIVLNGIVAWTVGAAALAAHLLTGGAR